MPGFNKYDGVVVVMKVVAVGSTVLFLDLDMKQGSWKEVSRVEVDASSSLINHLANTLDEEFSNYEVDRSENTKIAETLDESNKPSVIIEIPQGISKDDATKIAEAFVATNGGQVKLAGVLGGGATIRPILSDSPSWDDAVRLSIPGTRSSTSFYPIVKNIPNDIPEITSFEEHVTFLVNTKIHKAIGYDFIVKTYCDMVEEKLKAISAGEAKEDE